MILLGRQHHPENNGAAPARETTFIATSLV